MKAVALALASLALAAPATPTRLPPVEQCGADPSFVQFRTELLAAVARKDRAALMDLLADDVLVDFGGGQGKTAFAANWDLTMPSAARCGMNWMPRSIAAARQSGDALVSPSLIAQFPDELDGFETLVALPGTPLRAKPDDDAAAASRRSTGMC